MMRCRGTRLRRMRGPAPLCIALALVMTVCCPAAGRAADDNPAGTPEGLRRHAKIAMPLLVHPVLAAHPEFRDCEYVQMLSAIVGGARIGPGGGWFHGAESRYGWDWLAGRYDTDGDRTISRAEFTGPDRIFESLDRDGDGRIALDDFDWSDRSPYLQTLGQSSGLFRRADESSDGRIAPDEWETLFRQAAAGRDFLTPEDLHTLLFPRPTRGRGGKGPPTGLLIDGLLKGEIGLFHEGPEVGEPAPDFTLRTQEGERTISLSDYRGRKPVVLIFGSFT